MLGIAASWLTPLAGSLAASVTLASDAKAQGAASTAQPQPAIQLALIEAMSGAFANTGEAVYRNFLWAVERVNQRGGVRLPGGARPLQLVRFDSKGTTEEALSMLRAALDRKAAFILQGNSSAIASAFIDALEKNSERDPGNRALFLNYSAVEPALTNEKCSFWHFRFDANSNMRLQALVDVIAGDTSVKKVYLIGQDYSFGQQFLKQARLLLGAKRPDIEFVGDELHPMGRIKDFLPYASKIKASGAQAVLTGNWGNDLTLLIKSARDVGLDAHFYTFYGNGHGAPAAIGEAGVGRVLAVAEWHPNVGTPASDKFYQAFRARFPDPRDDYVHARMHVLVEMLVAAMEKARSTDPVAVARALEGMSYDGKTLGSNAAAGFLTGTMRASDHQFLQPLYVSVMQSAGGAGVKFDNEGSGFGFKTVRYVPAEETAQATSCKMRRP